MTFSLHPMSLTAISLSASPKRAASARAASSSKSRSLLRAPGRDLARASIAPSLATVRMRMIVARWTCQASAASAIVVSWRTS